MHSDIYSDTIISKWEVNFPYTPPERYTSPELQILILKTLKLYWTCAGAICTCKTNVHLRELSIVDELTNKQIDEKAFDGYKGLGNLQCYLSVCAKEGINSPKDAVSVMGVLGYRFGICFGADIWEFEWKKLPLVVEIIRTS